jgi:3(or 17)beta-hydroxysteroid dehydrogenase
MGRVAGKIAIVTGAASGLGAAIAGRLAAEGARVVGADLRGGPAEAAGNAITSVRHDVSSEESWRALLGEVQQRFGRLDILINNAGINRAGSVIDTDITTLRQMMAVNVEGALLGCQSVIQLMRAGGGGSIVNIASVAGLRGSSGQLGYSASKAAVINMTQSIALWCAEQRTGIRCNSICPGCVDTPIFEQYYPVFGGREAVLQFMAAQHPIGRIAQPEEIAGMALFLASDESAFATGSAFVIDGAWIIR